VFVNTVIKFGFHKRSEISLSSQTKIFYILVGLPGESIENPDVLLTARSALHSICSLDNKEHFRRL